METMHNAMLLIIDDDPGIAGSLSLVLEEEFNILQATNCRDALSLVESAPISLVLLDLRMPDMNGIELLACIRKTRPHLPVIIITGHSNHEWAKQCADLNVQGYLEKPINIEALIDRIKKLLAVDEFDVLRMIWRDDYEIRMAYVGSTVKKALRYIQGNYHRTIAREDVAAYLDVSQEHLSRQFYKECGIHMKDYINMLKVCKCKECLKDYDRKISDIGPSIGIPDANYLIRLFKKHTGLTPQEFRKRHCFP